MLKNILIKFIPNSILKKRRRLKEMSLLRKINNYHQKEKIRIRNKAQQGEKIKAAFFVFNTSIWKCDTLYRLLKEDGRFEPIIYICPFFRYGEKVQKEEMERSYNFFKKKGYTVRKALDDKGNLYKVKEEFKPDLVFMLTPWHHTHKQYRIENFLDTLSFYVPYGFRTVSINEESYNKDTNIFCWKNLLETKFHLKLSETFATRRKGNWIVTGYLGTDTFSDPKYHPTTPWKAQEKKKKRIIWAPHHSISGNISENAYMDYSTFFKYAEFMVNLAINYQDTVQFAFKPHPNLKGKLYQHWGEEKTDEYYNKWILMPNTQLEEGGYVDLFLTSDAMIHDSSSFLLEYLFTHKSVLYLINNDESSHQYNELGLTALENIQKGYEKEDIITFIEDTVLKGEDKYKEKRETFFNTHLLPPNGKLASENTYDFIVKELL